MSSTLVSSQKPFYLDLGWVKKSQENSQPVASCCNKIDLEELSVADQLTNFFMNKIVKEFESVIQVTTDPKIHNLNINNVANATGEVSEFAFTNQSDKTKHYVCWSPKKLRAIEAKYINPSIDIKLGKMDSKTLLGVKVIATQIIIRLSKELLTEMAILKTDDMKDQYEEVSSITFNNNLTNHPLIKSLAVKLYEVGTAKKK